MSSQPAPSTHIEVLPALSDAPLACTLGERELSARAGMFAAIFEHLVGAARLPGGFVWRFRNVPGLERRLRELARREHVCCPFLTFAVSVEANELVWRACGPEHAEAVLDVFYRLPEASIGLQALQRPGRA